MNNRDEQILRKILAEMEYISDVIQEKSFVEFNGNEMLKRAVAMTIINIGELVRVLSDEMKLKYPSIPFKEITATRNVTAHGYQTLRMDDIWETIHKDIPEFYLLMKKIVDDMSV